MMDPQAVLVDLDVLRALTANENGAQRLAWSPVWLSARAWFEEMQIAGLPDRKYRRKWLQTGTSVSRRV